MDISKIIDSTEETLKQSIDFLCGEVNFLKDDFGKGGCRHSAQDRARVMIDLLTSVELGITFLRNLEENKLK